MHSEIAALQAAGIEFELVPGVSSALAAPLAAGAQALLLLRLLLLLVLVLLNSSCLSSHAFPCCLPPAGVQASR